MTSNLKYYDAFLSAKTYELVQGAETFSPLVPAAISAYLINGSPTLAFLRMRLHVRKLQIPQKLLNPIFSTLYNIMFSH